MVSLTLEPLRAWGSSFKFALDRRIWAPRRVWALWRRGKFLVPTKNWTMIYRSSRTTGVSRICVILNCKCIPVLKDQKIKKTFGVCWRKSPPTLITSDYSVAATATPWERIPKTHWIGCTQKGGGGKWQGCTNSVSIQFPEGTRTGIYTRQSSLHRLYRHDIYNFSCFVLFAFFSSIYKQITHKTNKNLRYVLYCGE